MTQKTDQQLLELAAKALGLEWQSYDMGRGLCLTQKTGGMVITSMWNPRTDDGDCARMESAIGIDVLWYEREVCSVAHCNMQKNNPLWPAQVKTEKFIAHKGDKNAARRMASLSAAASIGETMP